MWKCVALAVLIPPGLFGQDGFGDAVFDLMMKSWERNLKAVPHDRGQETEITFYIRPDRIDPTLAFFIGVEDPAIELSLLLPDDTVVTQANASSLNTQWEVSPGAELPFYACHNMAQWHSITLPPVKAAGPYFIRARAGTAKRSTICATHTGPLLGIEGVNYITSDPLITTEREVYQVGEDVLISAPVRDESGRAVANANVEASIDGCGKAFCDVMEEVARIRLYDPDGDGVYTGVFHADKPSAYQVLATIVQPGLDKYESGRFTVVPRNLRLLSGTVVNTPGGAQVVMRFEVFVPGRYDITPTIAGASGGWDNKILKEVLAAGVQTVRRTIPSDEIRVLKLTGSLALTDVHVVQENPRSPMGGDFLGLWINQAGAWKLK